MYGSVDTLTCYGGRLEMGLVDWQVTGVENRLLSVQEICVFLCRERKSIEEVNVADSSTETTPNYNSPTIFT